MTGLLRRGGTQTASKHRSPAEIIDLSDGVRLRHLDPAPGDQYTVPIVLVPSLLSKYQVFDIHPARSMAGFLRDHQFDVWIVDWGTPRRKRPTPGFENYVDDWLDALVLGPRLPVGASVELPAFGAVGFTDRDIYDDKLVCASQPPTASQRHLVLQFFHLYARCKRLLNIYRRRPGRTACDGWGDARVAIERTQCSEDASARGQVPF